MKLNTLKIEKNLENKILHCQASKGKQGYCWLGWGDGILCKYQGEKEKVPIVKEGYRGVRLTYQCKK